MFMLRKWILGLAASLIFTAPALAQLNSQRIIIYGNGTIFHHLAGNVPITDGMAQAALPDQILNGTLWIANGKGIIKASSVQPIKTANNRKAINWFEIIKANIGKELQLQLGEGTQRNFYKGTVKEVWNEETGNPLILMEGADGTRFIEVSDVRQVLGKGLVTTVARDSTLLGLKFPASKKSGTEAVSIYVLQKGMGWHPSYLLQLKGKDKAALTMKATIINNLINAEGTIPTQLMVGSPRLDYGKQLDPLFGVIQPPAPAPVNRNHYLAKSSAMSFDAAAGNAVPEMESEVFETDGEQNQDFFSYNAGSLVMQKDFNQVATLYSQEIKVQHLYRSVLSARQVNVGVTQGSSSHPITHQVHFTNPAASPLMSAPVMIMSDVNAIGQLRMPTASPGQATKLDISTNTNIDVRSSSTILKREEKAKTHRNTAYDLVTSKATITAKNLLPDEQEIEIEQQIIGIITNAGGGTSSSQPNNYGLNENGKIVWRFKLKSGASKDLTYEFQQYIAR